MSQKSSVPQAVSFVSQVLKRDNHDTRYLTENGRREGPRQLTGSKHRALGI
jgi:hypothetical protein